MEDMDFGQASIDNIATTSSDKSTAISVDTAHQTSIDDTSPEARRDGRASELVLLGYRTLLDGGSSWRMEFDFCGSNGLAAGSAFSVPLAIPLIRSGIGSEGFVDVAAQC
ncbi:hypothetical protein F2Q68_00009388 [Brassica cretica]|uniref:Uncharacterized protein n=1 Tax=Brassica cretica TaxID=69181 RepID=A0A8S9KNP7_BRACR|nr:hypothetical protein F2Q68_00009388 [Brassica cretica]